MQLYPKDETWKEVRRLGQEIACLKGRAQGIGNNCHRLVKGQTNINT